MPVNIVPYTLPQIRNHRQPMRRPWNIEPSCVLALMPEINTTWVDYSEHSNPAVLTNRAVVHSGRWGQALKLNGVNTLGTITDSAELRFNTAFSISLWARRDGASSDAYGDVIEKSVSSGTRNYQIYWQDAANIIFKVRDATNAADRATTGLLAAETGVWRHLVGVYDGTNITFYIDKTASVPTAVVGTIWVGAQNIIIGRLTYAAGSNYHFNGAIDEILIFNRELKLPEIQALYEMGKRK